MVGLVSSNDMARRLPNETWLVQCGSFLTQPTGPALIHVARGLQGYADHLARNRVVFNNQNSRLVHGHRRLLLSACVWTQNRSAFFPSIGCKYPATSSGSVRVSIGLGT